MEIMHPFKISKWVEITMIMTKDSPSGKCIDKIYTIGYYTGFYSSLSDKIEAYWVPLEFWTLMIIFIICESNLEIMCMQMILPIKIIHREFGVTFYVKTK